MKDRVGTAGDLAHRVDVADITKGDIDLSHHWLGDEAETPSLGTRGIPQHRPNSCTSRHEPLHKGAANKPTRPGDHDRFVCETHAPPFRCPRRSANFTTRAGVGEMGSSGYCSDCPPQSRRVLESPTGDTVSRSNRAVDGSRGSWPSYDRKASPMRVRARAEQMTRSSRSSPRSIWSCRWPSGRFSSSPSRLVRVLDEIRHFYRVWTFAGGVIVRRARPSRWTDPTMRLRLHESLRECGVHASTFLVFAVLAESTSVSCQ